MKFEEAFNPVRSLGSAWELIKQAPAPMLVGGIILLITGDGSGSNGALSFDWEDLDRLDQDELAPYLAAVLGIGCCVGLVFFLISSWVYVGFAQSVEKLMRTGEGSVGALFDAKDRWVAMILTRLFVLVLGFLAWLPLAVLIGLPVLAVQERWIDTWIGVTVAIVAACAYLPICVYVLLGLTLSKPVCALEGLAAGDSVRRSWELASGNRITLLVYYIVLWFFAVLGFCLCCFGMFFTGAWASIAPFESYIALTRGESFDAWWIKTRTQSSEAPIDWSSSPPPIP